MVSYGFMELCQVTFDDQISPYVVGGSLLGRLGRNLKIITLEQRGEVLVGACGSFVKFHVGQTT